MRKIILFVLLSTSMQLVAQNGIRLPERPNRQKYVEHSELRSGFWLAVEANGGSSILFNHTNAQRAGAAVVAGYMFSEYLKVGAGVGANFYVNNNQVMRTKNMTTLPVFVDVRGTLVSMEVRNVVPYWSFDVGGAVEDGFFFSPTIGMRTGSMRSAFLFGVSYTLQRIPNQENFPEIVSFMSLKLGYEF